MSSAKFENAKALIKQGRYAEARALLYTIKHPMALDLLDEIDKLEGKAAPVSATPNAFYAPPVPMIQKKEVGFFRRSGIPLIILVLLVCCAGTYGLGQYSLSLTPTPTMTLTPSITFTPSKTYTPGPTYTPSKTPTVTPTYTPSLTATITPTFTPSLTPSNTSTLSDTEIAGTKSFAATATRQKVLNNQTATAFAQLATQTQRASNLTSTAIAVSENLTASVEAVQSTRTFVAQYKKIDIRELINYADNHIGEDIVIQGTVFNIIDSQNIQIYAEGNFSYSVYVKLSDPISGIYKDDQVTIYGTVEGFDTGTNAFGATIKFPVIDSAVAVKQ